jgi:hypothetical protein
VPSLRCRELETGDGTFTYVYSGRNGLVQVLQGTSTLATYQHNALGQRVAKTAGTAPRVRAMLEPGIMWGMTEGT